MHKTWIKQIKKHNNNVGWNSHITPPSSDLLPPIVDGLISGVEVSSRSGARSGDGSSMDRELDPSLDLDRDRESDLGLDLELDQDQDLGLNLDVVDFLRP